MTAPAPAPAYGEFVYVHHIVGNPYGNPGSTSGVEYTVDIENLISGGYMTIAPGSVPKPYTPPLGSRGVDPLNPALGQWAYVQNNVGTPYGVAGSTVGVEVTTHVKRLVLDGSLAFTLPPTSQFDEFPLYSDNTFASLGMVKDLMYAYYGGYDGSEGDYSHLILSQRLRDAIVEQMSVTYDPQVQALIDEARDYNADTKDARDATIGYRNTAGTHATTATTKAGEASASASAALTSRNEALSYRNTSTTEANRAKTEADRSKTEADRSDTRATASATSATQAQGFRDTASTHAGTAATQAGIATTKAGESSTHADRAQTARTGVEDARTATEGYRDTALSHKNAAATSATESADHAADALAYRNTAGTHATTATTQAGIATTRATTATTQAGIATTKAGEADTSRAAAAGHASAAAGSATAADGHADRAEAAANEFDLTATSTTGAPGSSASITVTGDGPAYGLSLTIPRGDKGDKGDEGEISQAQLDAAVASLVDNAPEALNTLSELSTALGGDPNFATTVSTEIGKRALIDGAPAAYNTLGKLVTALQNHELGGSTDASVLEGALTGQVDVSDAMVDLTLQFGDEVHHEVMPLSEFLEGIYSIYASVSYSIEYYMGLVDSKADTDHTHDGADITGALTDQVDVTNAMIQIGSGSGGLGTNLAWLVDNKSDTGHTHPVTDLSATGRTTSNYLRGDGTWATPPNNTYTVPTQAEAEAGTSTNARAFSAQRVRQAANAAITAREWTGTQAQYDALATKDPLTTYYVTE